MSDKGRPGLRTLGTVWGVSESECRQGYPCDSLVGGGACYFRGVTVHASPSTLFRWLCQLRAAPYSYDWIDNFGRKSPQRLTPGLERLERGQPVMRIFELVTFEPECHLTLRLLPGSRSARLFGELAVSYVIRPGAAGCRLLAKLVVRYPPGLRGAMMRAFLPVGDLIMMRRQLLNLKRLAERQAGPSAAG